MTDVHASRAAADARAAAVKARAADLGFAPVGIATAEPFTEDEAHMLSWLADGYQAGMGWMSPERTALACNPDDLLPGARSLVVVGAPYAGADLVPPADDNGNSTPRGAVARYARGQDYHDVMKARLQTLAAFVRNLGSNALDAPGSDPPGTGSVRDASAGADIRTRIFVDASPLPERAAAVRAGLGFVGKNTNLLTTPVGSWLLLGAILTTLDLTPDAPLVRGCGQCRLCLDACPTDAFPAPFVLDANRCISYLTIELRGPIPRDLRPLMGDHLFGCDDCQTVCPWNRRDRGPGWPEFSGPIDMGRPRLADVLGLDAAAFRDRYRRTPIPRTKRRGLLRNAAVALGNTGSPADLPALATALRDAEPLVRGHAAWAIGQIGGADAPGLLLDARNAEVDADVIEEIDAALDVLSASAPSGFSSATHVQPNADAPPEP